MTSANHDLSTTLYALRERAAEQGRDGLCGDTASRIALMAYGWLGDNIEAFVADHAAASPEAGNGEVVAWHQRGGGFTRDFDVAARWSMQIPGSLVALVRLSTLEAERARTDAAIALRMQETTRANGAEMALALVRDQEMALALVRDQLRKADLPADVVALVIAARNVAFGDPTPETLQALDKASEAFSTRVPWEDQP